ncbi:MAG: saccharopine dehydrogenase NADP-binding domain-containing protein [Spirochaetota bacterium]
MAKVTVLGGCGAVGSVAVRTLVTHPEFSEVVIADYNMEKAEKMAADLGKGTTAAFFDAHDADSIRKVVQGSNVVLNCVGPFYSTVKTILEVVLDEKIDYVDVCDDVDVTLDILEWDSIAKEKGVRALIGMGSSPGVTNILARLAADSLLDEVEAIDIFHTHGGEPFEGEGVIEHRFHCMSIDIPMYLDGRLQHVKYFGEDGIALREEFTFPRVGDTLLYPYPHPEQVTIPKYIPLKQVTNKGSVLPEPYYNLIRDICALGLQDKKPVNVKGQSIRPYDFSIAYIIRERDRILKETGFGEQRGCVTVIAKGKKEGSYQEYRFHMASTSQALGEGTGIPAAMGAIAMHQGMVKQDGVLPPEACINAGEFINLVPEIMQSDESSKKEGAFEGFLVEQVDGDGNITIIDL